MFGATLAKEIQASRFFSLGSCICVLFVLYPLVSYRFGCSCHVVLEFLVRSYLSIDATVEGNEGYCLWSGVFIDHYW